MEHGGTPEQYYAHPEFDNDDGEADQQYQQQPPRMDRHATFDPQGHPGQRMPDARPRASWPGQQGPPQPDLTHLAHLGYGDGGQRYQDLSESYDDTLGRQTPQDAFQNA